MHSAQAPQAVNWEPHGSDASAVAQMWRARWPGESKSGYLRSVSVLNPDAWAWAPGVPLSEERHRGAAAAAAGRIYVAGGFGDDGMLRSVESWAPGEVDWREARSHHLQILECQSKRLCGGGGGERPCPARAFARLMCVLLMSLQEPALPMALHSLSLFVRGGRLYALGGASEDGLSAEVRRSSPNLFSRERIAQSSPVMSNRAGRGRAATGVSVLCLTRFHQFCSCRRCGRLASPTL